MQKFLQLALHLVTLAKIISGEFTNPGKQGETLILGQSLRITYRGIDYQNYTIALWQQSPTGGSASLGPAIFRMSISRLWSRYYFLFVIHLPASKTLLEIRKKAEQSIEM